MYAKVAFPLATLCGLAALFRMSLHTSQSAEVLGRWSLQYAYLLALAAAGTSLLAVLSVPDWRKRLLHRSTQLPSQRLLWALPAGGLLLLALTYVTLINVLPVEEGGLTRVLVMLTLSGLALPVLWLMHRHGAAHQPVAVRRPRAILLVLLGLQLIQIVLWIGLAPEVHRTGDLLLINVGVRQAFDIRSFIMRPDHNVDTWFNFYMLWPLSGVYMRTFGVGVNQARFFYLLTSALALPFIGLITRKLYGRTAAFVAILAGIAIPLQYNWVLAHSWVATATAIALFAMLQAYDSRRPVFWSFLSGLAAVSAVEGHVYGGAFSIAFCVLWLWRWHRSRRPGEHRIHDKLLLAYVAGCLSFTALWAGYHIALPGISPGKVPGLISETWAWESNISNPTGQVGLTPANLLLQMKIYLYTAPVEFLLLGLVLVAALVRRSASDRLLSSIAVPALIIFGLFLGHVNDFYLIFVFPFFTIWFGAWLGNFFGDNNGQSTQGIHLSGAGLFVLLATILLYALFAHARSLDQGLLNHRTQIREMERIGREIDSMLPAGDVVVAGDPGYYLGMPQRLNYAVNFSFTWNLPRYWAFDTPQAVIVTFGVDDGYSNLDTWLMDRDFRPAGCFSVPGLGDELTVLYLPPEFLPPEPAGDCSPQALAWPGNP